jgi:hypothetical protein
LTKPIDPQILLDKVRFHVHRSRHFPIVEYPRPTVVEREAALA